MVKRRRISGIAKDRTAQSHYPRLLLSWACAAPVPQEVSRFHERCAAQPSRTEDSRDGVWQNRCLHFEPARRPRLQMFGDLFDGEVLIWEDDLRTFHRLAPYGSTRSKYSFL